ncbi:hypothetical protein KEC58_06990 [Photobacterium damselae]|uniref:hypothetical protein n=1 Tax=Photobacterium damselae TaxID=38293 RepID=UPI002543A54E
MSWKEFMALVLLIEFMVLIGMLAWAIPTIIDGIMKTKRRNRFGKELSVLFEKNKLDRPQIEILSKEYYLNSKDIQLAIRREFKEALTSGAAEKEKSDYFQSLFEDYERDEPFEGLPSDVRLHLERVRDALGKENDHMLQPLASQLQDLNDENVRKQKKMWWVSVASLMIGIASLVFAAYVYYKPTEYVQSTNEPKHNNIMQPTLKSSAAD